MEKVTQLFRSAAMFTLLIVIPCIASAGSEEIIIAEGYIFKVSEQWSRVSKVEEREVRNVMLKSTQGFSDFNQNFFVFNTPDQYMIIMYDVVYRGEKPSFKTAIGRNEQRFEMGVRNGIVKTVLSNKVITIGNKSVLESDWVGNSRKANNRNLSYTIASPNEVTNIIISAFFPENETSFANRIRKMLSTINFSLK